MFSPQKTARLAPRRMMIWIIVGASLTLSILTMPGHVFAAINFALWGLVEVAPLVIPGILLTAWIIASGADAHIAVVFDGHMLRSVLAASAIGAITPVCGVTVLPLMAGLLAAGVPLAPIMAFWLSSPVTDPAMLATTVATLGLPFAVGKTAAAFGMGAGGGLVTALYSHTSWSKNPLRDISLVNVSATVQCGSHVGFQPAVWTDSERRYLFKSQLIATSRLILICLMPAFIAEYALNAALTPGSLGKYVGGDKWWAIPVAVFVGAPAYIDGYAALPLTRGLVENGMSQGAAMAFLVSGGVVSIWGAIAIFPVLKPKPFILYLLLAILGSLIAGYIFEWVAWHCHINRFSGIL